MVVGNEAPLHDAPRSEPAATSYGHAPEPGEQVARLADSNPVPNSEPKLETPDTAAADSKPEPTEEASDLSEAEMIPDSPAGDELKAAAADTSAEASQLTARAFEEARNRLLTLTDPAASQGSVFEPFKPETDVVKGIVAPDLSSAAEVIGALGARAMSQWRSSAEAAMAHWQSLAGAKSVSEAIVLNAGFARQQIETLNTHAREITEIASQLARQTTKPRG